MGRKWHWSSDLVPPRPYLVPGRRDEPRPIPLPPTGRGRGERTRKRRYLVPAAGRGSDHPGGVVQELLPTHPGGHRRHLRRALRDVRPEGGSGVSILDDLAPDLWQLVLGR